MNVESSEGELHFIIVARELLSIYDFTITIIH